MIYRSGRMRCAARIVTTVLSLLAAACSGATAPPAVPTATMPLAVTRSAPQITEFPITDVERLGQPYELTVGWDDRLWFTPYSTYVGSITTTGVMRSYRMPGVDTATDRPAYVTTGPDRNIWFTNGYGQQIGKIDHRGKVTMYQPFASIGYGWTEGIVSGPRHHLWVVSTGFLYGQLVELDTTPRVLKAIDLPGQYCYPGPLAVGDGDALWVGSSANCPMLQRVTIDGKITDFPVSSEYTGVWTVAKGLDGDEWFTGEATSGTPTSGIKKVAYLGKISRAGRTTTYPIGGSYSTAANTPDGLTLGPDGNMWFTQPFVGQIGNMTPAGVVTLYTLPGAVYASQPAYQVAGIVTGPDGNMWFAQPYTNQIGEFVLQPYPHFVLHSRNR